ncbi:MAG TPA: ABC transporter substrate-binding protein [Jatrophihabitans sp.]|nr:ABC transporter substrate-binding protein [Jatrophihabitans sp.]
MRIVSLLPAATEIVYALGLDDELVGVTFECSEPARARTEKAVVVGGLDTTGLAPAEIDRLVRARAASGEDLYTLHAGALRELAPDLILSQDLCQVCAVPAGQVELALATLGCQAEVLTLDPRRLDEVLAGIELIGQRTGVAERAAGFVDGLTSRLVDVGDAVAGRPQPRVAVLEWVDPPFQAGHWVPDLVEAAGGISVLGTAGGRSVPIDWPQLAAAEPEVVLVAPCGFELDAAVQQGGGVLDLLPAGVQVWAIDADGLVVRPGPRLVDGVEAIAAILHPDAVAPHPSVRQLR